MALRNSAKKSPSKSGLRSKASSRTKMKAQEPMDEMKKGTSLPPPITPSQSSDVPPMPMPKYGYINSFASIPSLRKGGNSI
jgi:hypothetical protein